MLSGKVRATIPADAGISVLEMIAVLVICALVATVVSAAIETRSVQKVSFDQITQLIASARLFAERSGQAETIVFEGNSLSDGKTRLTWNDGDITIATGNERSVRDVGLVVLPDGTVMGPALSIHDDGGDHPLQIPTIVPASQ